MYYSSYLMHENSVQSDDVYLRAGICKPAKKRYDTVIKC